MIKKTDNPVYPGVLVWRGWLDWSARVESIGEAVECPEHLLVPVRFKNGQYGILAVSERMKPNGRMKFYVRELAPQDESAQDAIRFAKGMPAVIGLLSECYRIAFTDGDNEGYVHIRRGRDSMVSEQVMFV